MEKGLDIKDPRVEAWYKTLDYIETNNIKYTHSKKFGMSVPQFGNVALVIRYINNYNGFVEYIKEWSQGKVIKYEDGKLF